MARFTKPPHKRYVFHHLSENDYSKLATEYSVVKSYGTKAIFAWVSGTGIKDLLIAFVKTKTVQYGKEKIAAASLVVLGNIASPLVCMVSNATYIVSAAKCVHSVCAFVLECADDTANLSWLPLDMVLFGQPIPVGEKGRYNFLGNISDIFPE